jgi:hypothetical protein
MTDERQTYDLYRHFDAGGNLLYVGVSFCAVLRLSQHRKAAGWYGDIVRVEIERFPTREDVLTAERKAIAEEKPKHNIHFNGAPDVSLAGEALDLIPDAADRLYFERAHISHSILSGRIWYNLSQASDVLGISTKEVRDAIESGWLKSFTKSSGASKSYKFSAWQLLEYLELIHIEAQR